MITTEDIELLEGIGKLVCEFKGRPNRHINATGDYESARKLFYAHLLDGAYIVLHISDQKMLKCVSYGDTKNRVDAALSRLPYIHSEMTT